MQHRFCIETVDRMLQDIQDSDQLFGGLAIVMGGDFAQILPVVRRSIRASIVRASIQCSYIWPRLSLLFLQKNLRLQQNTDNQEFATWLQEMSYNPQWRYRITLPPFLRQTPKRTEFYEAVFTNHELQLTGNNPLFFRDRVILTFFNDVVFEFNESLLRLLPGDIHTYDSVDSVDGNEDGTDHIPQEVLRSQTPSG